MRKTRSIVIVYLAVMVFAASILLIVPFAQYATLPPTAYASEPAHVYEKNTGPTSWRDSFDVSPVSFEVAQQFTVKAYLNIHGYMEASLTGNGTRFIRITYDIYCNDQKVKTVTDTIVKQGGPGSTRGGSSIPNIPIPSSLLIRGGSNRITVHACVDSDANGTETCSFLHRVEKMEVKLQYDGAIGVSNFIAYGAVGLVAFPPSIIAGKKLSKPR